MTNGNDPINLGSEVDRNSNPLKEHLGLTKREYFAAMAMQGIVSNHQMIDTVDWIWLAENSVKAADALINALNQEK